jgi:sterol desaturase/sphingolipid hydroxylase (fatty acid hydroxylase superfamily)
MKEKRESPWVGPVLLGAAFAGLFWMERRRPLRMQKKESDWQRVPRNMAMAALVAAEVNLCERPIVAPVAQRVARERRGLLPRLGLPPLVEKVLGLVLLDYSLYWWHILLHRVPFLWRSHVVHHADLKLDSTTALRFHAMEFVASIPWRLAQVRLLGISPPTLALWQRLTLLEVTFHHSNVRLPRKLEQWLSRLVVTPDLHGIHHSVVPDETHSNFSSGLTIWDRLHGTWRKDIAQEDIEIGVPAYHDPEELKLSDLIALPFERQRPAWHWKNDGVPERQPGDRGTEEP